MRIRCERSVFRAFKKVSVDYDSYEETLKILLEAYEKFSMAYPEFAKLKKSRFGKYQTSVTLREENERVLRSSP